MRYRMVKRMERTRNKNPCAGCVWPMYAEGNKVVCPFQRCVKKEYEPLWLRKKDTGDEKAEAH